VRKFLSFLFFLVFSTSLFAFNQVPFNYRGEWDIVGQYVVEDNSVNLVFVENPVRLLVNEDSITVIDTDNTAYVKDINHDINLKDMEAYSITFINFPTIWVFGIFPDGKYVLSIFLVSEGTISIYSIVRKAMNLPAISS
jgi:hypothetical protein